MRILIELTPTTTMIMMLSAILLSAMAPTAFGFVRIVLKSTLNDRKI